MILTNNNGYLARTKDCVHILQFKTAVDTHLFFIFKAILATLLDGHFFSHYTVNVASLACTVGLANLYLIGGLISHDN